MLFTMRCLVPLPNPIRGPSSALRLPRGRSSTVLALLAGLCIALPRPVGAQGAGAPRLATQAFGPFPCGPSERDLTACLVTVGPGDAVWERFGHSLLWIHDPEEGTDVAYNYGLFSFEQEHFILRFIMGEMRYAMAGFDAHQELASYRSQNRSIEIQELSLGPERVKRLERFLEWNALPDHRFYDYRYFRDNCSTRVRDAMDSVVGGQLGRWARSRMTDASYRDHVLRLSRGLFWASIGMDFGLGPSVDKPLTAWQAMFVPMEMAKELRSFTVTTEAGDTVPFVRTDTMSFRSTRPPVPDTTPRWIGSFALAGLLLTTLIAWLGARAMRGSSASLLWLAVPWLLALGLLGSLLAFLWAFTGHVDTRWNANLLQASPLHLVLAVLLWPLARKRRWAQKVGRWIAGAIAVLACAGALLKVIPVVEQANAEFVCLLLPSNLALAWVAWRMGNRETEEGPRA